MRFVDIGLLILSLCLCLFGLVTLYVVFTYLILGRGRQNCARRTLVVFGSLGLLIAAGIGLTAVGSWGAPDWVYYLWPTAFVLGAGEYGDPLWYVVLVFSVAILSNVGLYGGLGFFVGWVWSRIRAKWLRDASAH